MTTTPRSTRTTETTDAIAALRERALRFLARREYSRQELAHKLGGTDDPQNVATVLQQLAEAGWQSDARFAENLVRQRLQQGYGPLRIRYELQQRGVDCPALDALVGEQGGWEALIQRVYLKKYADLILPSRDEWAKRCRFLQQRGFDFDTIAALRRTLSKPSQHDR